MVVPINNIVNGSKLKENITITYSGNLGKIENPMINPDFGKVINRGSDTNYNITVNYSTDLTHPELVPQNPVQNPVLERIKTLNPVQEITIVGRGIDPEVITNHPTKINPYVREQSITNNTMTKPTLTNEPNNITNKPQPIETQATNQIQQILNGLTLPEIFNILSQYGINANILKNAKVTINGNEIILNYTYSSPLESVLPNQSGPVGNITNNYTLEIENVNGWIIVKYKNYQTGTYEGHAFSPSINETYYVINPITKKVTFTGPDISEATIWKQPLMSPSDTINSALSQYGYTLAYGDIEKVNNLQPGQSITVYAVGNPYGSQLKIINLGNGQYEIQSTTPIYNKGQWISIDESVNIPTATENVLTGSISTTNYNIIGYNTLQSSGSLNATKLATYEISESYPITYKVNNNQITFQFGNPSVNNTSLYSINVPTITTQQLQELQSGQNIGLKPGWYYNPNTGEFIQVSYQTVQQPQINWNQLWYGYSSMYQNNPYWFKYSKLPSNTQTNTNTTTQQPQILQNSFFSTQLLSDIWNNLTTIGNNIYSWFSSLSKSKNSNTINYSQLTQIQQPQQSSYITGVLAPPVKLSGKQAYQAEIQNIIFESQQIEQEVNNNQAYGGPTWLGIDVYSSLAQAFAGMGLKQPAEFFLNLEQQAQIAGTPANILANVFGLGEILGSIAMVEYSVPEEIGSDIGTSILSGIRTQLTPLNFAKNYALTTAPNLIFSNLVNYQLTGQPLSLQQNLELATESVPFTFVYSGISGYYEGISNNVLGKIISPEETNLYKIIGSKVLYDTGANFAAGTGANLAMQAFSNALGWQNGINWNEALFSGILSGGITLGVEGIQGIRAIKSGGSEGIWSIASGSPYRYKTSNVEVSFPYNNLQKVELYATDEATYFPQIGSVKLTPDMLSNVKPKTSTFETEGKLNLEEEEIPIQNENGITAKVFKYTGELTSTSGNSKVTANTQGIMPIVIIPKEYSFGQYTSNIETLVNELGARYPEFKEISYIPQEGLAGFESLLRGNTYLLFNNYNAYLYNSLIGSPLEIASEYEFTPNEYLTALQYAEQTYREISNLPNNIRPLNLPNQEALNIRVPFSSFQTENPNPNEDIFGKVIIENIGRTKVSTGETYETQSKSFGPVYFTSGENNQLSTLLTTYGSMENPESNIAWYFLHQSGSVLLPGNVQLSWGVGEAIDPNLAYREALQLLEEFKQIEGNQPVQNNIQLTQEQLRTLLGEAIKSNAESFTYPPPLYRSITTYGFPTGIFNTNYNTNQNVINSNNNYNISMSRVPNMVQQINNVVQQLQYNEKLILNEYNIQNELSTIRENLREQIRLPNQIQPIINVNQLENYGKQMYYGIQNIQPQRNQTISKARPLELGKELLRPRQKLISLERENEEETILLPEFGLLAAGIYREETTKPTVTTITITPTITKPKTPTPTIPPTTPPIEFPPFGFPEITIMGQPIRGLIPGLSRGVRTMYDIQYALSRLTL